MVEIIALAIGVAMDAFAISICKGITIKEKIIRAAMIIGIWFGLFQGLMPLMGCFLMNSAVAFFNNIKEYIIFGLLFYIGISMILESKKEEHFNDSLAIKEMFVLSIATSLDAFSVGMTLPLLNVNVYLAVIIIAVVTFIISCVGVVVGHKFGSKYKSKAEVFGGIILIIMGFKSLLF